MKEVLIILTIIIVVVAITLEIVIGISWIVVMLLWAALITISIERRLD